jgi:hypothetical protein
MSASKSQASISDRKKIEELEAEVARLRGQSGDAEIGQAEYIKIVNLCPDGWHLNLSTKGNGQGKVYKFEKFGQTKKIIYMDLMDIIENHLNFVEAGRFYILDKRVIRQAGLDAAYEKILDKNKIEEIFTGNMDNAVELYSSANKEQQQLILDFFITKLRDNPDSIDLNLVDKITRISGVKIVERAEDDRALLRPEEPLLTK